jgi:hypothetical protein
MVKSNTSYRSTFRLTLLFMTMCIIMGTPKNLDDHKISYSIIANDDSYAEMKMTNSRSMVKFVRRVATLQTTDTNKITSPEDWESLDILLIIPPLNPVKSAGRSMNEESESLDLDISREAVRSF